MRLTGAASGSFSGNISHTSTGATERLLPVSGRAVTYFALTIEATNGSVTLNPPGGSYPPDTTVTLTPVPDPNYIFDGWSGTNAADIIDTDGTYTILMNANKSVTANFVTAVCEEKSIVVSADTFMNSGNTKGSYNYGGSTTIQLNPYYQQGTDQYRAPLLRWDCAAFLRMLLLPMPA